MKKFIRSSLLEKLLVCMTGNRLSDFNEQQINMIKIFFYVNAYRRGKYSIGLDTDELLMIINFVFNNQHMLVKDNNNVDEYIEILAALCSAYTEAQKPHIDPNERKRYYIRFIYNETGEKIKSIKALREMTRADYNKGDIFDDPENNDFGGLKWAKYAIEDNTWFGPVSKNFLNNIHESSWLFTVSEENLTEGKTYKKFIEDYPFK